MMQTCWLQGKPRCGGIPLLWHKWLHKSVLESPLNAHPIKTSVLDTSCAVVQQKEVQYWWEGSYWVKQKERFVAFQQPHLWQVVHVRKRLAMFRKIARQSQVIISLICLTFSFTFYTKFTACANACSALALSEVRGSFNHFLLYIQCTE